MTGCGCGGAKCRLAAGDARHGTRNGYGNWGCRCVACTAAEREYTARYRAENAEKERERKARWSVENAEKVREYAARYHAENAEKVREYAARYRVENAERERERQARYRAENAEKIRERNARYRVENAERERERQARYRAENAERERERQARYYAENAEKVRDRQASWSRTPEGRATKRACRRRRRERKRSRYCSCDTRENLAAVWSLDSGRCAYCNAPGTDYEHVVPLARGGWGCVSNFRVACQSCNSRKGTQPLSTFLARLTASGVKVRPGATNSGLPCPAAAARMAVRMCLRHRDPPTE